MAIDLWPRRPPAWSCSSADAHLSNFGVYASPERHLALDINDFDETSRGRWEWDVKRLVASVELCGRDNGLSIETRAEAVATGSRRLPHADGTGCRRSPAWRRTTLTFGEGTTLPKHWCPESLRSSPGCGTGRTPARTGSSASGSPTKRGRASGSTHRS